MAQLRTSETRQKPISDPEPQVLREFRLHVEKLSQNLKSQSKLYGLYQSIFNVLQPLQTWCSGHPQQRELFRHGVAILQSSDAWPLLLQWLAKGVRNLTASGSIQQLVAGALSLSPRGGQAPDGATSGSVHTHNAALMLVFTAVHTTSELAREMLLAARPRRGHLFLPSSPPPPPLLLETSCRTFRALLSSHILRAYARVAAHAADAVAAAAAASISPARGRSSAGRSGSGSSSGGSSSSGGGGSSSASSAEGLAKMALESLSVACGTCAEAVTVNEQLRRLQEELEQARPPQLPQLQRQTLQSEQPVQPLQLQGQPPRRSGKLKGQPEEAVAQARDVGPSASTSGGRGGSSSGHGGSGSSGGGSGSSSVPQEFGPLLLSEVAASGLLEHCARLLLLSAGGAATAGAGANVGAGAGLAVAGAVSSSSSSGSSGLFERLWFGLCINASKVGLEWLAHSSSSDSGSGCSSPSSGSCGGVSAALPRSAPPAPPPAPWGSCLQTYAWSQVAATLAAAGFGGGERGVWGLPAELAAGLPLLTSPEGEELTADELRRRAQSRGQGVVRLCVEPFQLLLLTLEVGLRCRLLAATAGAEVAAATAGTAAAGPAQEVVVVGPARPRAGSGAGGGKRRHGKGGGGGGGGGGIGGSGSKGRSRGETAGPSSCSSGTSTSTTGGSSVQPVGGGAGDVWSFPFSPRAAALVLIRSADLAVASVAAPPHTASNKTSAMTMTMPSSPTTPGAAAAATKATTAATAATALREKAGAVSAPATSQRRAWQQQQQQQQGPVPGLPLLRLQRDGASDLALAALSRARQLLLGQWREAAGLLAVERERPPAAAVVEEEAEAGAEAKAYGRGHGRSAGGGGSECGSHDGHSGGSSSRSSSSGGSGGGSNCDGIRSGSRGSGGGGGSAKGDSSCGGGGSAAARTGCGGAADAAIANTNTNATAAAASQGDSGSSSFPQLPLAWWRSAAAVLRCYAGMTPPPPSSLLPSLLLGAPPPPPPQPRPRPAHHQSDCDCGSCEQDPALRLSTWAREALRAEAACRPEAEDAAAPPLTPRPPRGLAVAVAGGIVPAVEAAVRAARHHPEALGIACAFLQVSPHGVVGGGGGWPLFRQLLAFAPPAQTASLITSIGKRLHAALDTAVAALAPPASANTPAGGSSGSGISGSSSTSGGGAAGAAGGMTRAAAVRQLEQCTSLITSVLPAAAFRTDGGGLAAQRRVWLLVWHAIHRWLPPLARCIRLLQLLDSSDDSGSSSGGGGSSGGGSNGGGSGGGGGGGSSRGSQELLLLCDCYSRCVLEPVAALADRAADAAGENGSGSSSSSGGGGSSQAVAAAVADAVAGSWRQWLLHEADVLGVCEVAIERLAVTPAGSEPAAAGAAAQLYCLLTYLTAAVPDSLLPVLTASPAWQRDVLSQALNPHLPAVPAAAYGDGCGNGHAGGGNYDGGCGGGGSDSQLLSEDLLERLESLVAAAEAMGLSVSQLRATAFGGPVARAEQLRSMRRPVGEGEQQALAPVELEAAAAAAAAAARVVGLGEKMEEVESEDCGAAGGGGGRAAAVEAAPPPAWAAALRCCSNPRCVNLEGEGEAGLPLSMCGGCRAARYCGGGCQRAHWGGGGHKEACKALRAGGMAAAAGAHA